jgi:hypothetical protein
LEEALEHSHDYRTAGSGVGFRQSLISAREQN